MKDSEIKIPEHLVHEIFLNASRSVERHKQEYNLETLIVAGEEVGIPKEIIRAEAAKLLSNSVETVTDAQLKNNTFSDVTHLKTSSASLTEGKEVTISDSLLFKLLSIPETIYYDKFLSNLNQNHINLASRAIAYVISYIIAALILGFVIHFIGLPSQMTNHLQLLQTEQQ